MRAKEVTETAQEDEQFKLAYIDEFIAKIENANNSSAINKDSQEQLNVQQASSLVEHREDVAPINEELDSNNTSFKLIDPKNYGDYVYYPIDLNEDGDYANDWKIFYSNDKNIFLISADYLSNTSSYLNTEASNMITDGTCILYWEDEPEYQEVSEKVQSQFMAKSYSLNKNINNSKCVSTLLNFSNWKGFVKDSYADYAIGSPTLEMWIESWNEKYKDEKKLYFNSDENGYYVGNSLETNEFNLSATEINETAGYEDTLYYPHTDAYEACYGYWLSSPSQSSSDDLMYVGYNGSIDVDSYYNELLRY